MVVVLQRTIEWGSTAFSSKNECSIERKLLKFFGEFNCKHFPQLNKLALVKQFPLLSVSPAAPGPTQSVPLFCYIYIIIMWSNYFYLYFIECPCHHYFHHNDHFLSSWLW